MKKILLAGFLSTFALHSAQMNYSFETAQGFTVGPIAGQAGWGGTSAAYIGAVTAEQANPGTQSLKITGNNGTVHSSAGAISPTVSTTGSVVTVLFNAYFTVAATLGDECDFFFSPQSPSQQTINARMNFDFQGNIKVIDGPDPLSLAFVDTNADFTRGSWNTYKIELDFVNNEAKYYQNGTLIYTGFVVGGTMVGNLAITNDNYNSSAYFDGIQVVSGVLGTSEADVKKISYKLYPNPTSDFAIVESTDKINSIEVFDFSGKKLNVGVNDNKVDLRNLAAGVYLINVTTPKGRISDRIIKK
ncbi:T9SS C-terminal target domain-containing protein [Chryseobacterium balustinum]|uniref:Por secretion system C-terminal sorting domain n=2 Tax=Chryseobacterium balustinum TaxID=246 RepID=A0AAX2IMR9_9FLAO|nr:T9SS C-terminal target domain-containing protein [Chryseobacterium balustinum]SKB61112.1 Por secretion system C-terminal sorting domain-containing protein [Chryseobacterium balustinum]SQA91316.1 Por secretion system C-terminal sorting domain [Chryseobacterium balustinum]